MEKPPFTQLGCDLSLRRPGFALLRWEPPGSVCLLGKCNVQANKKELQHGCILTCIYDTLREWIGQADVLVREKGFSRYAQTTQALFKVVGVADLAGWQEKQGVFHEISPLLVKKLLTGNARATKQEVADALEAYVGLHEYECDDESDAVAVGVTWLIDNGLIRRCGCDE